MNQTLENPAQKLWQDQPVEGMKMSVEAVRLRAGKFERRIARRNLRESVASAVVIIAFGYFFVTAPNTLLRITWSICPTSRTGDDAPEFVPGAMAAISPASSTKNPADAARAPLGST